MPRAQQWRRKTKAGRLWCRGPSHGRSEGREEGPAPRRAEHPVTCTAAPAGRCACQLHPHLLCAPDVPGAGRASCQLCLCCSSLHTECSPALLVHTRRAAYARQGRGHQRQRPEGSQAPDSLAESPALRASYQKQTSLCMAEKKSALPREVKITTAELPRHCQPRHNTMRSCHTLSVTAAT